MLSPCELVPIESFVVRQAVKKRLTIGGKWLPGWLCSGLVSLLPWQKMLAQKPLNHAQHLQ
jgi:hypothetical protein